MVSGGTLVMLEMNPSR